MDETISAPAGTPEAPGTESAGAPDAAGGENIFAGECVANNFALPGAKRGEAEVTLEQLQPGLFGGIHRRAIKRSEVSKASFSA
jgi:hypothetical protein